jgi:two-component system NarL family sensor kinase
MYPEETRILYATLIAAGVLAILLAFFIITIIKHQRRKLALEKEKLVSEILLLENERSRIAADLHDELGSVISAIKLNLECLNTTDEQDIRILERTGSYIDTTMQKIREISNNLMPKALQKKGLFAAVKEYTEMIDHSGSLSVRCQCPETEPGISAENEIHIYRIVQEITNNSIKHALASVIDVQFAMKNNTLLLDITDNGNGFDITEASKKQGQGLQNIMRRVDMLQGTVYLVSTPSKGTHYAIEIPI